MDVLEEVRVPACSRATCRSLYFSLVLDLSSTGLLCLFSSSLLLFTCVGLITLLGCKAQLYRSW